jgi:hypothetical protein
MSRMRPRLAVACALLVACGKSASHGDPDANGPDAPPDARDPHAPPSLTSVTPSGDTWLHEPVRLIFDEPLDPHVELTATATVAGQRVNATISLDDAMTVAITIDPAARGVGALDLHVAGTVTDPGGNQAPVATDIHLTLPAWSAQPVDLGTAASSPAIVVDDRGAVIGAWLVGSQVVVAQLYGGQWSQLGAALGGSAASPAITVDSMQRVVVGWTESGVAHVARWNGAWTELASPGNGSAIALATPPMGNPIAAVFGATASALELTDDRWQPIGTTLPIASMVGEPALAVGAQGHPALGWIDGARIVVYRFDSAWTAIAPITLPSPPSGIDHMSLAMHDTTLAVAYDAWAGSFGVLAATTTGTTWTRLDHLLDLDPQSDAVDPAIAIDASGAPIVAWTEFVEGMRNRGLIARWSGSRWQIVGGTPWLPDPDAVTTRPALALHAGGAPVVGYSSAGQIAVQRFNGPAVAPVGIAQRASIAGCSFNPNNPPPLLSQTGCFTMTTPGQPTPHPGLVPYAVGVQLWSDGDRKRRWIALPDGASMTASSTGAWAAPNGTLIFKEFAYERTPGSPATRRAMETRVLVKTVYGFMGFSYQWNPAGTDASLLTDGEWTYVWPLDDGTTHTHLYPSRSECISCHQDSYGPLLGIRPPQLARWFDYDGQIADQLPTLATLGVGPATTATPFVSPHDPSETLEHRMRGYMAANCAHCHNVGDISIHDLRYTTPLAQTNLCPDIVPGNPGASLTYQLVSSRPGMPPLATLETDPLAVRTLYGWIAGMTSCP